MGRTPQKPSHGAKAKPAVPSGGIKKKTSAPSKQDGRKHKAKSERLGELADSNIDAIRKSSAAPEAAAPVKTRKAPADVDGVLSLMDSL